MSEHALVPAPCRRPRKDGGLAQVLQRRTPSRGNRPKDADNAAGSRWRSQPGVVNKAEKSNRRRSKDWSHCVREWTDQDEAELEGLGLFSFGRQQPSNFPHKKLVQTL